MTGTGAHERGKCLCVFAVQCSAVQVNGCQTQSYLFEPRPAPHFPIHQNISNLHICAWFSSRFEVVLLCRIDFLRTKSCVYAFIASGLVFCRNCVDAQHSWWMTTNIQSRTTNNITSLFSFVLLSDRFDLDFVFDFNFDVDIHRKVDDFYLSVWIDGTFCLSFQVHKTSFQPTGQIRMANTIRQRSSVSGCCNFTAVASKKTEEDRSRRECRRWMALPPTMTAIRRCWFFMHGYNSLSNRQCPPCFQYTHRSRYLPAPMCVRVRENNLCFSPVILLAVPIVSCFFIFVFTNWTNKMLLRLIKYSLNGVSVCGHQHTYGCHSMADSDAECWAGVIENDGASTNWSNNNNKIVEKLYERRQLTVMADVSFRYDICSRMLYQTRFAMQLLTLVDAFGLHSVAFAMACARR